MKRVHMEEMIRFAKSPANTKVWACVNKTWMLLSTPPSWFDDTVYIVDDDYSELRKAFADGETIEVDHYHRRWEVCDNPQWNESIQMYRIKPKVSTETRWQYLVRRDSDGYFSATMKHFRNKKHAIDAHTHWEQFELIKIEESAKEFEICQ